MVYVDHIRPLTEKPDFSEHNRTHAEAEKAAEKKSAAPKPKQKEKPKKKGA